MLLVAYVRELFFWWLLIWRRLFFAFFAFKWFYDIIRKIMIS